MHRSSAPVPILVSTATIAIAAGLILKLAPVPHISFWALLLVCILIGAAAGGVTGLFYLLVSGRARELRRRVESLLPQDRSSKFNPSADELEALSSSLELSSRQIRVMLENLQRQSARLEAILGSMVEGVVAVDPLLRITFLNRAFAEAMGTALPVAPGTLLVQVVRDHALMEMFSSVLLAGEPRQKKLILTAAGERSYEVQIVPISGDPHRGAIAMLYDITDIERLERIRKDFVANVSHELRTPLAAISGYAETLLEGGLEDPAHSRKFVEIILNKGRQLANIVQDLLILSTLESGKPPAPAPISLRGTIESAIRTVEPVARSRGIRLLCESFEDQAVVGYEILENAIKFNRPDGEVHVEVARDNGRALVHFRDTGLGIPSRDLPRIFERFYRVDKARSRATGGTGLGLAIVKHAVEQMGGSVSVESRLGEGSVFTVALEPAEDDNIPAN